MLLLRSFAVGAACVPRFTDLFCDLLLVVSWLVAPPTCSHEAEAMVARVRTSSKMCFCRAWSRRCQPQSRYLSGTDPLVSLTSPNSGPSTKGLFTLERRDCSERTLGRALHENSSK